MKGTEIKRRAKEIFLNALECSEGERDAFVNKECQGHPELMDHVQALLCAHHQTSQFIHTSGLRRTPVGMGLSTEEALDQLLDTVVGPYRIRQRIGEGGFGVVYMAEQEEPVRRMVALKIIKPGMDTRQVIARFEAERQALALMDHPNIARVLDAGATESGHPFVAMELVRGVSITDYCDQNQVDTIERIGLFCSVCHAVQHAHQKGVIHRDIKPSNVLVTMLDGRPVPKVIDFGIAKAINQRLTEKTVLTEARQLIGTPLYMSPEQAQMDGLDVDTRTDIYSLGVLLYHLLTGTTPFDPQELRSAALGDIQRLIRELDPPRPSTRLKTIGETASVVAAKQRASTDGLFRLLRRDLDWVVMRALEKDRTRRYGSASEFAQDLERFLRDEPVLAGPPSVGYKVGKFVRRHRVPVTVAAILVATLVTAVVGMTAVTMFALDERARAEQQARIAQLTNTFLNEDLLGQADPMRRPDPDVRLRTVLDAAADRVDGRFDEAPLVEADIRMTIGMTYTALGEYDAAEEQLVRAHRLREAELGRDELSTMRAARVVGEMRWKTSEYDEAESILTSLLDRQLRLLGEEHPETLETKNELASVFTALSRLDEAQSLREAILQVHRRTLGDEHSRTLLSMNNLGIVYRLQGRYELAAKLHREALETRRRILGDDHLYTLDSMSSLALVYQLQGKSAETESLSRQVADTRRRVLGPEHPLTLDALNNVGYLYTGMKRYDDARPYYEEVLEVRRRTIGDAHTDTLLSMNNLGWLYTRLDRHAEAETILVEMLETMEELLGSEHPEYLRSLNTLGGLYEEQGRLREAEAMYRQTIDGLRETLPADHPDHGIALTAYGRCLAKRGRLNEAEEALLEAQRRLRSTLGPDHPRFEAVTEALAGLEAERGEGVR